MPWEEWRDVGPETGRLASDISRGAPLSSKGPTDRDEESHSEPGTTVKEGSTLWTSTAPPRSSFSNSVSRSIPLRYSLFLQHLARTPSISIVSLSPSFKISLFCRFRLTAGRPLDSQPTKASFLGFTAQPANNREHVISYSAYHTHYPSIFCPAARLTRWNLLRGNVSSAATLREPRRSLDPGRRKWPIPAPRAANRKLGGLKTLENVWPNKDHRRSRTTRVNDRDPVNRLEAWRCRTVTEGFLQ